MKSLLLLLLSVLPYSTSLPDLNYSEETKAETSTAATFADPTGQIVYASCSSNPAITYFKVYVYPVSGTPPATLYRFEDGAFAGTVTYSSGSYFSAVSLTATNVRFSSSSTGVPVYAAAAVSSLGAPCVP